MATAVRVQQGLPHGSGQITFQKPEVFGAPSKAQHSRITRPVFALLDDAPSVTATPLPLQLHLLRLAFQRISIVIDR